MQQNSQKFSPKHHLCGLGVNFINILRTRFSYKSELCHFSLITVWLYDFLAKGYRQKSARKMLMKLTIDVHCWNSWMRQINLNGFNKSCLKICLIDFYFSKLFKERERVLSSNKKSKRQLGKGQLRSSIYDVTFIKIQWLFDWWRFRIYQNRNFFSPF